MKRRTVLGLLGAGGVSVAAAAAWKWPEQGLRNPCRSGPLPATLTDSPLYQGLWRGIDPQQFRDVHVHVAGLGDGGSGIWVNPKLQSPRHPAYYVRFRFYRDAACWNADDGKADHGYLERLLHLQQAFPAGSRFMLLAFDYYHDTQGRAQPEQSFYYVPNHYVAELAHRHPQAFEWFASIHPYRADSEDALYAAVARGARGVKWLPQAMGIQPDSPRCDHFYAALARLDIPLLCHTGDEHAVAGVKSDEYGNPLRLRRALEQGVRVIMAHSACDGHSLDIDRGKAAGRVENFDLFGRLMDEPQYHGLLYGDISAITQVNRMGRPLEQLVKTTRWHDRLLYGSDYPLPGVMPLYSIRRHLRLGYINAEQAGLLATLREYNPVLFDFALKRMLNIDGRSFSHRVFEANRVFAPGR